MVAAMLLEKLVKPKDSIEDRDPLFHIRPLFENAEDILNAPNFFKTLCEWKTFKDLVENDALRVFFAKSDATLRSGTSALTDIEMVIAKIIDFATSEGVHCSIEQGEGSSVERGYGLHPECGLSGSLTACCSTQTAHSVLGEAEPLLLASASLASSLSSASSVFSASSVSPASSASSVSMPIPIMPQGDLASCAGSEDKPPQVGQLVTWQPGSMMSRDLNEVNNTKHYGAFTTEEEDFFREFNRAGREYYRKILSDDSSPLLKWIRNGDTVKEAVNRQLRLKLGPRFSKKEVSESFKVTDLRAISAVAMFHRLGIPHTAIWTLSESFKDCSIRDVQTMYEKSPHFQDYIRYHIEVLENWNPDLFNALEMPDDFLLDLRKRYALIDTYVFQLTDRRLADHTCKEKKEALKRRALLLNKEIEFRNEFSKSKDSQAIVKLHQNIVGFLEEHYPDLDVFDKDAFAKKFLNNCSPKKWC